MAAEVAALAAVRIKQVAGGWRHSMAVDDGGNVYTWGWGKVRRAGGAVLVRQVLGRVGGYIRNPTTPTPHNTTNKPPNQNQPTRQFGQLGLGDTADRNLPTPVTVGLGGRAAALIACGWRHSVAATADGGVWSWGRGTNFQLGHGDEADRLVPTQLPPGCLRRAEEEAAAAPSGADGNGAGAAAGCGAPHTASAADRFAVVPEEAAEGGLSPRGGGGEAAAAVRKKARLDDGDAAVPHS